MDKFFHIAEIICTILIGLCGCVMIIGGVCIDSWIPILIGAFGILFCVIVPKLDKE